MKKSWFSGFVTALLIVSLIGSVSATVGNRTATLDYNNIKVTLDGKAVSLVDTNGNPVEPFAIAGTTYLPVRAISSALGLEVGWDQSTSTVILTTPGKVQLNSTEVSGLTLYDVPANTEVELATIKVKVTDYYETNRLSSPYNFEDAVAQAGTKFVVFKVEVETIGETSVDFPPSVLEVFDGQNRVYQPYNMGSWYFTDYMAAVDYPPNTRKTGTLVCQVQADSDGHFFVFGKAGTEDYYKFFGE